MSQIHDSTMSRAASSSGFQASASLDFQMLSSCGGLCWTRLSSSSLISRICGGAGNSSIHSAASISSSEVSSSMSTPHCSFSSSSKSHSLVLASSIGERADSEWDFHVAFGLGGCETVVAHRSGSGAMVDRGERRSDLLLWFVMTGGGDGLEMEG